MSKINDEKLKQISIEFSKLNEYEDKKEDIRFTEVLIKILHLGRNYNGSVFTENAVKKALPSLANTPILGYIEENKEGEDDFSDHRSIWITDKDGNKKIRYAGNAYGVITETYAKEAYFEDCVCSDGVSRRFLFCKALLWNKFDYVLDIFNNSDGVVKQSMELADEYEGHWTKDGFEFDSFMFDGCCAINVQPAMIDSKIELSNFSANDIADEIKNKLNKYELLFNSNIDKEVDEVGKPNKEENKDFTQEEIVEEVETEVSTENEKEEIVEENVDNNDSTEEVEVSEEDNDEVSTENTKEEENEEDEVETEEACKKKKYTFSLSHDDIRCKIFDKLYDLEDIENEWYSIVFVKDNYFIYHSYGTGKFYKQSYTTTDTDLAFNGEREEVYSVFVDKETYDEIQSVTYSKLKENYESVKTELDIANGKIVKFEKENKELLEFKNNADEEARKVEIDNVISNFSNISELDLETYRTKAYNKEFASNKELEDALYIELGKLNYGKVNTQVNEEKTVQTHYSVSLQKDNKVDENVPDYGAFNHIFKK